MRIPGITLCSSVARRTKIVNHRPVHEDHTQLGKSIVLSHVMQSNRPRCMVLAMCLHFVRPSELLARYIAAKESFSSVLYHIFPATDTGMGLWKSPYSLLAYCASNRLD